MRLKKLELQGYKSFAHKTEFLFFDGITTVVGPNGSGKSNIADAIRWVLGEQSYRLLRGKRTEDMIFSGSTQRSRAGMAQVTLVLDNSDGRIPIDFNEVSISRRAYRSGENAYYINNARVRLRDVIEVLGNAGLGRTSYTVIGQGMVDAALALQPEQRRSLIEEAAGITLHKSKREEALEKLEATQANLLRVKDIIAEISPRLQTLKRQAERAQEYAGLTEKLTDLLRVWYGYQWHVAQEHLEDARARTEERKAEVAKRTEDIQDIDALIQSLRDEHARLREELTTHHNESSRLHSELEVLERDLAVWEERLRQIGVQREELTGDILSLETNSRDQASRSAHAQSILDALDEEVASRRQSLSAIEGELQTLLLKRGQVAAAFAAAREEAFTLATRLADCRNRVAQLEERRQEMKEELSSKQKELRACEEAMGELERALRAAQDELDTWNEATALLEKQRAEALKRIEEVRAGRPALQEKLAAATQAVERLRTRHDVLARSREDMEGYFAGVRSVMQTHLPGIVGPLAGLLHVPPELERAIETALGNHLQDIVVERWDVAERAIDHLKRSRGGRATFLPLDTLRPPRPVEIQGVAGIYGVAADLVQCEERIRPAVELLLNRTVVAEDLRTGHRAMEHLRGGYTIVTVEGEIIRAGGSVTGGHTERERGAGMFAREREWRELPEKISQAEQHLAEIVAAIQANQRKEAGHLQTIQDVERDIARRQEKEQKLSAHIQGLRRKSERLSQEAEWHRRIIAQLNAEFSAIQGKKDALEQDVRRLESEQGAVQLRLKELEQEEAAFSDADLQHGRNALRAELAGLESKRESQRSLLEEYERARRRYEEELAEKRRRLEELEKQQEAILGQHAGALTAREELQREVEHILTQVGPAQGRLEEIEAELEKLQEKEDAARRLLHEAESRLAQASLQLQRQEEHIRSLYHQIEEDLGIVELEPIEGVMEQVPLPLHPLVSQLPRVTQPPEGLEEQIRFLRSQIRRLGAINPEAPQEYASLLTRHNFLIEQVEDLEGASRSLHGVISELDELMEKDFMQTFRAVNAHFKTLFTNLFGGGEAKLVLTDPDNPTTTGVEIIARPPGKRLQNLALLSGGERSLTAVALIFAILKVSPTPFCFLDEVDAMLDEANVGRFREALKSLSEETQFIVITHNRGTVEAANTIYGISMGEDGTSRCISLRLEGQDVERTPAA